MAKRKRYFALVEVVFDPPNNKSQEKASILSVHEFLMTAIKSEPGARSPDELGARLVRNRVTVHVRQA